MTLGGQDAARAEGGAELREAAADVAPRPRHELLRLFVYTLLAAFGLMVVILALLGCAPFGNSSLAQADGAYQYIYFFSYLKDIIAGENAIDYTFSNQLGGSGVGIYSYYLASPFNLLAVFFEKAQLESFFDLVVALKLAFAAGFMAVFLRWRFPRGRYGAPIAFCLALGYAFSQCVLFQADNIMWFDGIYLLPLMLLGVSRLVRRRSIWFYALMAGLAILFNWYSGFISLAFTVPWLLFEGFAVGAGDRGPEALPASSTARWWGGLVVRYLVGTAIALAISAILLVPTIIRMLQAPVAASLGRTFDADPLFRETWKWIPQAFAFGAAEWEFPEFCLWCGALTLCGCVTAPFWGRTPGRARAVAIFLLACAVSPFVFSAIDRLLGLLKPVESYWPRYGYGSIAYLSIVAAWWLDRALSPEAAGDGPWRGRTVELWVPTLAFCGAIVALQLVHPGYGLLHTAATCVLAVACLVLLALAIGAGDRARTWVWLLVALCVAGAAGNGYLALENSRYDTVDDYGDYIRYGTGLAADVGPSDGELYRVSVAYPVFEDLDDTQLANAPFAFGLPAIEGYTSTPDGRQLDFLSAVGYENYSNVLNVVQTPLLPIDSLLGVRYVVADRPVEGLELVEAGGAGQPSLYENPYALPMAFTCSATAVADAPPPEGTEDPFQYQNDLYTALLGEESRIFVPATYERRESTEGDETVWDYTVDVPEVRGPLFGEVHPKAWIGATLEFPDGTSSWYADWLTGTVFTVPTSEGEGEASLALRFPTVEDWAFKEPLFYRLDLDRLAEVTARLSEGAADVTRGPGNEIAISVEGSADRALFTSIPTDQGWQISLDGEPFEAGSEAFAGLFLTLPLAAGKNAFTLGFHLPGLVAGLVLTLVGLSCVVGLVAWERRDAILAFAHPYLGFLKQGGTYLAVGVGTAVLELVLFETLYRLGMAIALANVIAVCISTAVNFALNGTVTFKGSSNFGRSLILYLLLFAANTTFSTLTISFLVGGGFPSLIAKGLTQMCIVCWNFVLYKKVVFV